MQLWRNVRTAYQRWRAERALHRRITILAREIDADTEYIPRSKRAAHAQALRLLQDVLTADEWEQFTREHSVTVRSQRHPNRTYRVPYDGLVQVFVLDRWHADYCLDFLAPMPKGDQVAAKVLLLKTDEAGFFAQANNIFNPTLIHVRAF